MCSFIKLDPKTPGLVEVVSGTENKNNVITQKTTTGVVEVKDTARQCPGDKFSMECAPKSTWATFDATKGLATANPPMAIGATSVLCVLKKTAVNGEIEELKFKLSVVHPKSRCMINAGIKSSTIDGGAAAS